MICRGFKICRVDSHGGLASLFRSVWIERVRYFRNKWACPPPGCGPLSVFSTLDDAGGFVRLGKNEKIFECEYVPWLGVRRLWVRIWAGGPPKFSSVRFAERLPGIRLAKKVKLIREVRRGERMDNFNQAFQYATVSFRDFTRAYGPYRDLYYD